MLNNYLEKRAAGGAAKILRESASNIWNAIKRHPRTLGTTAVVAPGAIYGTGHLIGNLTAGDTAETLAALNKANQDLANERAKGIADHAGDNIGMYALAGTGLLGLGALGAYLASKPNNNNND